MIRYRVMHRSTFEYGATASSGQTVAYLVPREREGQRVLSTAVVVEPLPDHRHDHDDVYGNHVVYVAVERPHDRLVVEAVSEVEIDPAAIVPVPSGADGGPPWERTVDDARTTAAPTACWRSSARSTRRSSPARRRSPSTRRRRSRRAGRSWRACAT